MTQYNVTGMSCAACSARVEKAVSRIPGVTSCSVSLLTNSMGRAGGSRNAEAEAPAALVARFPARADVFFDGTHDVGLAAARVLHGQPCGDGPDPAAFNGRRHGHQPEILHQRLPEPVAPCAEHGYACRSRRDGSLRLQHLRPLRHDRRTGARRHGGRDDLHDGLLLRVRRHDPHAHHRRQDARGPLQGPHDRRAQGPDEARAADRDGRTRR